MEAIEDNFSNSLNVLDIEKHLSKIGSLKFEVPQDVVRCFANIDTTMECQVTFIESENDEESQKASDVKTRLHRLSNGISRKTEDLKLMREQNKEFKHKQDALTEDYNLLKAKESKSMKEICELENLCKKYSVFKVNPVDRAVLNSMRTRVQAFKNVTGIKWDFCGSKDEQVLKGIIFNPKSSCVKSLLFDFLTTSRSEIIDQLWKKVARSSNTKWPSLKIIDEPNGSESTEMEPPVI